MKISSGKYVGKSDELPTEENIPKRDMNAHGELRVLDEYLKFIDSKDIREFNKDTLFSPAEIAALVTKSRKTTVAEKAEALRSLIQNYGTQLDDTSRMLENEFEPDTSFCYELTKYLTALDDTLQNKGMNWFKKPLYIAGFAEIDYNSFADGRDAWGDTIYFDNYDAAYDYLVGEKKYYLDDDQLKNLKTSARIEVLDLSDPEEQYDSGRFLFNNALEMCAVDIPGRVYEYSSFEEIFYVHVPSPFHTGDIVKWNSPFYLPEYGVIDHEPESRETDICLKLEMGDGSDIQESLDIYCPPKLICEADQDDLVERRGFWCYDHIPYLELEKCSPEEIPEELYELFHWKEEVYDKNKFGKIRQ